MSGWAFSDTALQLHDAVYGIETAWEGSRPVTRAMCGAYHHALDRLLADPSAPREAIAAELVRIKGWHAAGIIPSGGSAWAQSVISALEKHVAS